MVKICKLDMPNKRGITINDYLDSLLNGNPYDIRLIHSKPFRQCRADTQEYTLYFDESKYYILALTSYKTVRAIVIESKLGGKRWFICAGNYSQTTTQHLHKFFKDYNVPIKSLLDIEYCTLYDLTNNENITTPTTEQETVIKAVIDTFTK